MAKNPPPPWSRAHEDDSKFRNKIEAEAQARRTAHYRLEMQGKRVTLKHVQYYTSFPSVNKRGPIYTFTRRARARMLRKIAEVDWQRAGEGAFVTLTYPDDNSNHTMEERKTHRYLINRYICHCVGRHLGCFWRVEWMPRLTGKYVGELRPHMHLLYLNHHNIGEENVRTVWERVIHAEERTQVKIQALDVGNMVACYIAKYCAKQELPQVLDNVPKRNKTGRHAGQLRNELIPYHPMAVAERVSDAIVRRLQERAYETLWWFDPRHDDGFTILGETALELIKDMQKEELDICTYLR